MLWNYGGIITAPGCRTRLLQIALFLANYFDERLCVATRHIARSRNISDASDDLGSRCANCNLIADANFMCRLCNALIEEDKPRITEFLSHGAAGAEAAEF